MGIDSTESEKQTTKRILEWTPRLESRSISWPTPEELMISNDKDSRNQSNKRNTEHNGGEKNFNYLLLKKQRKTVGITELNELKLVPIVVGKK